MNKAVYSETYKVSSYLVNLRGQAGLYSILNFVQDVGWMHAEALRFSLPENQGWVFTRQKLVMSQWPSWNQSVTLRTWLRKPEAAFIYRDYEFYIEGIKIGECTSTFAVIDTETRKLAKLDLSFFNEFYRQVDYLEHYPEKILWNDQVEEISKFQVRNSDIDLNQHVNNTKYAQWILDSLPLATLKAGAILSGYEVNFLAESKIGDLVSIQQAKSITQQNDQQVIQFQGTLVTTNKPLFVAKLYVSES